MSLLTRAHASWLEFDALVSTAVRSALLDLMVELSDLAELERAKAIYNVPQCRQIFPRVRRDLQRDLVKRTGRRSKLENAFRY
jgi:hypothetical protein